MNEMTKPDIGHNSDNLLDPGLIRDQLGLDHVRLIFRRDALIAAADRWERGLTTGRIEDEETAGKSTDFGKQIKALIKEAEAARVSAKGPYDAAAAAVQSFFKVGIYDRLDPLVKKVEKALTNFAVRQEEERREEARRIEQAKREEADRLAKAAAKSKSVDLMEQAVTASEDADAAGMVAAAPSADLGRVRGDYGGVSALRTRWTFEVTDKLALIKAVAAGHLPVTFLEVSAPAINGAIKAGQRGDEHGLRIFGEKSAGIR